MTVILSKFSFSLWMTEQAHQILFPVNLSVVTQEHVWMGELKMVHRLELERRVQDQEDMSLFVSLIWWCPTQRPRDLRSTIHCRNTGAHSRTAVRS